MEQPSGQGDIYRMTERQLELAEDTNRVVHSMRRGQRWHTIFQIIWWLTIVGISGYTYITYVQPYVGQIMSAYGNAQDFQVQIQNFFAQFARQNPQ
jgi:hypothetical protein